MPRELVYKLVLIFAVAALCLFLAYPPQDQIKLGLDLRGGIHLVLEVMVDEAVTAEVRDDHDRFLELMKDEGVEVDSSQSDTDEQFTVTLPQGGDLDKAVDLAAQYYSAYEVSSNAGPSPTLTLRLSPAQRGETEDRAVRQALQTIRNRVDAFGVAEPVIQRQGLGENRLLVQLPGVEDPERVKSLLRTSALLELKLVEAGPAGTREELLQGYGGELPESTEILPEAVGPTDGQQVGQIHYYLVQAEDVVTGRDLKNARLQRDEMGLPAVGFTLNATGARKFERATEANIGRQLAIVLDRRIHSAPVIQARISAQGIISGHFTVPEAEDLALVLRAGALPASIRYLEERSVGPSLGRESINRGVLAAIIGMVLVVAFMLVYYKGSGVNAVLALVLNMVIVLGVMASLGATLTLPGIAGMILLIGMAVDANVLIFERIREELDLGKTVRSAIDAGFSKAFSAILDANLTTLIAAVFLFQFGTGPVKGFAVTLSIGILASMFTALFVSRVLFSLWLLRRTGSLSI
ncbi:MAG: protein translocase subunit SecD [Acidobacteriota bacterium]